MDSINGIPIRRNDIVAFCKRNGIRSLSLFGSVTTERFTRSSDLDVLVEFEKGKVPGLFGISHLERELSEIFEGRKIDLRTPMDLSRYFRNEVIAKRVVLYAAS